MEFKILIIVTKKYEVYKMIYNQILVRFGDLTLKGKNQVYFLKTLYKLMAEKLEGLNVLIENQHDRIFINLLDENVEVKLPGGILNIEWSKDKNSPMYMKGNAEFSFIGEYTYKK